MRLPPELARMIREQLMGASQEGDIPDHVHDAAVKAERHLLKDNAELSKKLIRVPLAVWNFANDIEQSGGYCINTSSFDCGLAKHFLRLCTLGDVESEGEGFFFVGYMQKVGTPSHNHPVMYEGYITVELESATRWYFKQAKNLRQQEEDYNQARQAMAEGDTCDE
jgi:hypothetical protein